MVKSKFQKKSKAKPLSDLIQPALLSICRKRGFATVDILHNWSSIVGGQYSEHVQPEKIVWPRGRKIDGQTVPEPGTLVVRADSSSSVYLAHEKPLLIERINTYYGWNAITDIRIVNGPVIANRKESRERLRSLTESEIEELKRKISVIKSDKLRESLFHLGEAVIAKRKPNPDSELGGSGN